MAKIRLKEPYLGNIALCLVAEGAIKELQNACEELGYVAEAAKRARVAVEQLHEDWSNWLEDPTQETLQPVLADLHDLKALQPRLHEEVLSFFEPADKEIDAVNRPAGIGFEKIVKSEKKLKGSSKRMKQECSAGADRDLVQQTSAKGRLGGDDFTGQLHKTTAACLADAVQQVRHCIAMTRSEVNKGRVRCD